MPHKPLIYILPKESSKINEIVSQSIQSAEQAAKKGYIDIALNTAYTLRGVGFDSLAVGLTIWGLEKFKENRETRPNSQDYETIDEGLQPFFERVSFDLNDWLESIEQIPFAAIPEEISFPPGHPIPRRLYRVHPLKAKENQYIPFEVYDSILYEEREAELIKILVDLGAVEIIIEELSKTETGGSAEAKASLPNTGGVKAESGGEQKKSNTESRKIELKQKKWTADAFHKEKYSWLLAEVSGSVELSRQQQKRKLFKVKFVDGCSII